MGKQILILALTLLALGQQLPAAAMFSQLTGENHPELRWRTLTTEHFRIHYHQGLEQTARDCADVAEQVYEPVTRQLDVTLKQRTDLAICDADNIVNGAAFKNTISIWVNQNDYIRHFSARHEWLRVVIAHEFQHTVAFAATSDWCGMLGRALSGTPTWWYEGLAEYFTEDWGALRSDQTLRAETLDGRLDESNAHDIGYAKVLYLARAHGDSSLVKICRWRDKRLGTHNFKKAFKQATGRSLAQFETEFERVMRGVYNAEYVAGEPLDEIGRRVMPPLNQVSWLDLLPDSCAWLAVGRDTLNRLDRALYRVDCDSTHHVKLLAQGKLGERAALSADGARVVFERAVQDEHGAFGMDLWELDLATRRERRLTRDGRSGDPAFAADGALAWIASEGGRSRLMLREPGGAERALWDPGPGWQLSHPSFAPDGRRLALGSDDPASIKRITLVSRDEAGVTQQDPVCGDERDPVWMSDSLLVFTGLTDCRANLHARHADGRSERVSDSGEGLWAVTRLSRPGAQGLVALALDSARISRPLLVDPTRRAGRTVCAPQPRFTTWRDQRPALRCPDWDHSRHATVQDERRYNPLRLKPMVALALPVPDAYMAIAMWADPLFKNQVSAVAGYVARDTPVGQLTWMNSSLAWSLSLTGGWNSGAGLTLVNDELLGVNSSFIDASAARHWRPFQRPYGRLQAGLSARVEDSRWQTPSGGAAGSPFAPRDGRSGRLAGSLSWVERPLERDAAHWPGWGHGLRLAGGVARPWLYGDEQVDYWQAQAYRIQPLGVPALRLYAAARLDALTGRRRTWRALGFGPDPLLLPDLGEQAGPVSHLRALDRDLPGDRAFQSTLELRLALGEPDLFQALGFANGRIVLAPFADFGRVGDRARLAPADPEALWLWTSGLEAQVSLKVEDAVLVDVGLGLGSEDLAWLRAGDRRKVYWTLHLVRPF